MHLSTALVPLFALLKLETLASRVPPPDVVHLLDDRLDVRRGVRGTGNEDLGVCARVGGGFEQRVDGDEPAKRDNTANRHSAISLPVKTIARIIATLTSRRWGPGDPIQA